MNILPSQIRSLSPAILISVSSTVSVLALILKQPVPSLPLLSTLSLTTVILSTSISRSQLNRLQQIQKCLARTVIKTPKSSYHTHPQISALKINKRIEYKLLSLTYKVITTNQLIYLHNLICISQHVEPAPHLLSP